MLYCVAAAVTNKSGWSQLDKANPEKYEEIVNLIKPYCKHRQCKIEFAISVSDIALLEQINREKEFPFKFRINVFREDFIKKTVYMVRKPSYRDGKTINVLLVDFNHQTGDFSHYILIDSLSFFKQYFHNKTKQVYATADNKFC